MKSGCKFPWLENNDTHSLPNSEWWRRHKKATTNAWNKNRRHKGLWSEATAIPSCAEVVRGPLSWGSCVSLIRAWFHFLASATTYIVLQAFGFDFREFLFLFVCFVFYPSWLHQNRGYENLLSLEFVQVFVLTFFTFSENLGHCNSQIITEIQRGRDLTKQLPSRFIFLKNSYSLFHLFICSCSGPSMLHASLL